MSILQEATDELRTLTTELLEGGQEGSLVPTRVAERLQRVVALLSDEEASWIGTTEAKRLLGVRSEHTVEGMGASWPAAESHVAEWAHSGAPR